MAMTVDRDGLVRMREQLFFEGDDQHTRLSRFWLLLPLSAVIASAGVVGDSTATVIGAMIVAPLMTPILGIALAAALADRTNLLRSVALVVLGALAVIAVGYAMGLITAVPVVAADNSQVASRVSPKLVDLVAALATGAVGAVALCRSDISDTLPGVAIAISLVPPLTVVGLTLQSGEPSEALGALLLFVTNVSAILAMGTVVMAVFKVPALSDADPARRTRARATQVVVVMVLLVAIPLAVTSVRVTRSELEVDDVRSVATDWTEPAGWDVDEVTARGDTIVLRASGPAPAPGLDDLRDALDEAGLEGTDVEVELVPSQTAHL
jgi:uncharacterized hydrophobic protein (TIGR00271 family)